MTETALITGASSGIGREIARTHAETGGDVVLTARREDALEALRKELESAHGVKAHVFVADLSTSDGPQSLIDYVIEAGIEVDILVNNAGLGGQGAHVDRDITRELAMIDVNTRALVTLTHAFSRQMVKRGHGRILNLGSTAGFIPGPNQAVYFATKAFVNSFTQALDQELRGTGVTCTVLAPGYVKTEFAAVAGLEDTDLVRFGGASAESVARHGYRAMRSGKLLTINEPLLSVLMNWIVPLVPRRFMMRIIQKAQAGT